MKEALRLSWQRLPVPDLATVAPFFVVTPTPGVVWLIRRCYRVALQYEVFKVSGEALRLKSRRGVCDALPVVFRSLSLSPLAGRSGKRLQFEVCGQRLRLVPVFDAFVSRRRSWRHRDY